MTTLPPSEWLVSVGLPSRRTQSRSAYRRIEIARQLVKDFPEATERKILRGNAERLVGFTPGEPAE
jgi:hypothetical protein